MQVTNAAAPTVGANDTVERNADNNISSSGPKNSSDAVSAPIDVSAVKVSISAEAFALSQTNALPTGPNAKRNYDNPFFPTRDGYPSDALAAAVSDPAAESSSAGKTLDQTAIAARASMDAKYAAMNTDGEPFSFNSYEGRDWNALMGDLDRRSLLAVRENVGGRFSKDEQTMAECLMGQQQGMGMGLPDGPISQISNFHDPYGDNDVARYKAAITWLDKVSPDEKLTSTWMQQHAAFKKALLNTEHPTAPPKKLKTLLDYLMESEKKYQDIKDANKKHKHSDAEADSMAVESPAQAGLRVTASLAAVAKA